MSSIPSRGTRRRPSSAATTSAARPARPRSGTRRLNHGRGGWKANRYNNTFVGYIGRGTPELVIAVTIHEAKPLSIAQGNLPLAVESYELFRRLATDAMTMLDLPKPAARDDR